jgi:hypothetical protein
VAAGRDALLDGGGHLPLARVRLAAIGQLSNDRIERGNDVHGVHGTHGLRQRSGPALSRAARGSDSDQRPAREFRRNARCRLAA